MGKMKELATVLDELVTSGETLISTVNSLRDIFSGDAEEPGSQPYPDTTAQKPTPATALKNTKKLVQESKATPKTYTKEQLLGILALDKSD